MKKKKIAKLCKVYVYKSWVQKLQEFEQLQTSTGKSKKLKLDGLLAK